MYTVCIIVIILALILIIRGVLHIGDANARQRVQQFLETSDKLTSVAYSNSTKKIKDGIWRLDNAYRQSEDVLNESARSIYQEDRTNLYNQLHDLEQSKWEKKADKYLQEFLDCYLLITDGVLESFNDVELLFKTKKRCIDQWKKYYAIDLSEYETDIYPKRYMREWLSEDYDPCMDSHATLEKKLSESVEKMRPEYKRKMALYDIIVSYVSQQGTIARSDLLKKSFEGYIDAEVKCCYNALIKSNRLFETKLGGRYFVSLSDKEAAKPKKSAKKEKPMIANSDKLVHDAIVKHLMDEGAEYIDMTQKGGCLYFYSDSIADELKQKGYNICFAENGTRNTAGRPAWYLKP